MKSFLSFENIFFGLVYGFRNAALMASLICIVISAASCRSAREIEIFNDTVTVHDTTIISIHDTTHVIDIRYDSVDRYVEKTRYVDSNGVVHEKEVERLTKIINDQKDKYKSVIDGQKKYITILEKKDANKSQEIVVTTPLKWYQKTLIYVGVVSLLCVVFSFVYLFLKKK